MIFSTSPAASAQHIVFSALEEYREECQVFISLNSTGVILLSRSFCWGRQVWRYLDLMSSAGRINKSSQYSLKQLLYFEIMSIWFHYISLIWSPSAKELFQGNANNLQNFCIFLTPFIFPGQTESWLACKRKSQRQHSDSLTGVVWGAMGPLTVTRTCVCLEVEVLGGSLKGFGFCERNSVKKKQAQAGLTLLISCILYFKFLSRGRGWAGGRLRKHQSSSLIYHPQNL